MSHEPVLYKNFIKKFRADDTKTYQIFAVPIGNEKIIDEIQFHPAAPAIKYYQKSSNSCFLSRLA